MKKWLILGASGQLGKEWASFLAARGKDVMAASEKEIDITSSESLQTSISTFKPDIILNCAAYTQVDKAEEESGLAMEVNHHAVRKLAEICESRDIRLVHYSTDYVFSGEKTHRDRFPDGYPVSFQPNPLNVYGLSKWKGEQAIHEVTDKALIIRLSWLCSLHAPCFLTTMLRLADERDEIKVVNDQYAAPSFTPMVAVNSFGLIEFGATGIYHLSSSGETNWYDFAKEIFHVAGKSVTVTPVSTQEFSTKARRPAWSRLDLTETETALKHAITPWQKDLRAILESDGG